MSQIFVTITTSFGLACLCLAVGKFLLVDFLNTIWAAISEVAPWVVFTLAPPIFVALVLFILPKLLYRLCSYILEEIRLEDLFNCIVYILQRIGIAVNFFYNLSVSPTLTLNVIRPVEPGQQQNHGRIFEILLDVLDVIHKVSRVICTLLVPSLSPMIAVTATRLVETRIVDDLPCTSSSTPPATYVDSGTNPRRFIPMTKEEIAERDVPENAKDLRIKELLGEVRLRDKMLVDGSKRIDEMKQQLLFHRWSEIYDLKAQLFSCRRELDHTYAQLKKSHQAEKDLQALRMEKGRWAQDMFRLKLVRQSLAEERSAYNDVSENLKKEEEKVATLTKDIAKTKEDVIKIGSLAKAKKKQDTIRMKRFRASLADERFAYSVLYEELQKEVSKVIMLKKDVAKANGDLIKDGARAKAGIRAKAKRTQEVTRLKLFRANIAEERFAYHAVYESWEREEAKVTALSKDVIKVKRDMVKARAIAKARRLQDRTRLKRARATLANGRFAYHAVYKNLKKEKAKVAKVKEDLKNEEARVAKAMEDLKNEETKAAKAKEDLAKAQAKGKNMRSKMFG